MIDFLSQFTAALLSALAESAPLLILGFVIAGLIREFVSQETMRRQLGGRGMGPLFKAVGIGALLPICSCSTIPLGIGMVRSGAARGTSLAFMTSSPAISPVAIVLGLALLGPATLAAYVSVVVVGSAILGWIGNRWLESPAGISQVQSTSRSSFPSLSVADVPACCQDHDHHHNHTESHHTPFVLRIRNALHWSFFDLGKEISLSLLIGLSVATLILAFVPAESIAQWAGRPSLVAIGAVILLAIPAYTCSVPSIMIASSLMLKGASPGVAIAFLVAGPATNLGELNAVRAGMGNRTALFYCGALITLALIGGLATDLVGIQPSTVAASETSVAPSNPVDCVDCVRSWQDIEPWRIPFVLGLLAIMFSGVLSPYLSRTSGSVNKTSISETSDAVS